MERDLNDSSSGVQPPVTPSNFLAQLDKADYRRLTELAVTRNYAKGSVIFGAGAPATSVYFLESGQVKICQFTPLGREAILWFCLAGEIFGLAEVARGGGRVVDAISCDSTRVLQVQQADFQRYLAERPQVALLSMQVLASRLRVLGEMFVNLIADDANTRIAKLILRLSARYGTRVGKEILLNIPLTHQEIADMTGTTRQTVSTALSALKRQGVLSMENRRILIESEELLSEISKRN